MDLFSLVDAAIYKQSFTFKSTLSVEQKAHRESKGWSVSFEKRWTEEEALIEVSSNIVLKACFSRSSIGICFSRKKKCEICCFSCVHTKV